MPKIKKFTAQNIEISPNFVVQKFCGNGNAVSAEFRANRPKLYAFSQNFHIRKLGEISVFYAVIVCTNYLHGKQYDINLM